MDLPAYAILCVFQCYSCVFDDHVDDVILGEWNAVQKRNGQVLPFSSGGWKYQFC